MVVHSLFCWPSRRDVIFLLLSEKWMMKKSAWRWAQPWSILGMGQSSHETSMVFVPKSLKMHLGETIAVLQIKCPTIFRGRFLGSRIPHFRNQCFHVQLMVAPVASEGRNPCPTSMSSESAIDFWKMHRHVKNGLIGNQWFPEICVYLLIY